MRKVVARVSALCCALVAVPVTVPATARADEAGFLNRVHAAGMPLTDEKALTLGRATCGDLSRGIPKSAILESNNPEVAGPLLSSAQNLELFSAAVAELCPQFQSLALYSPGRQMGEPMQVLAGEGSPSRMWAPTGMPPSVPG